MCSASHIEFEACLWACGVWRRKGGAASVRSSFRPPFHLSADGKEIVLEGLLYTDRMCLSRRDDTRLAFNGGLSEFSAGHKSSLTLQ